MVRRNRLRRDATVCYNDGGFGESPSREFGRNRGHEGDKKFEDNRDQNQ